MRNTDTKTRKMQSLRHAHMLQLHEERKESGKEEILHMQNLLGKDECQNQVQIAWRKTDISSSAFFSNSNSLLT